MRKLVLAILVGFLLSGCIEMKQTLNVGDDGIAEMRTEVAMNAAFASLATQAEHGKPEQEFCPKSATMAGLETKSETIKRGEDQVCVMTVKGPIDTLAKAIESGELYPKKLRDQAKNSEISFKDEGDGRYRFSVNLALLKPDGAKPEEVEAQKMGMLLLKSMVAGRTLSWSVTAPEIIETTGTLSEDGRGVTYVLPIADLFEGGKEHKFEVVFRFGPAGFIDKVKSLFN